MEDGAKAVEQLEGREDATLHQHARHHRRRRPPAGAHGHLEEPLFEGHAVAGSQHGRHRVGSAFRTV